LQLVIRLFIKVRILCDLQVVSVVPPTDPAMNMWQVTKVEIEKPRFFMSDIDDVLPFDQDSSCALFVQTYIMDF
jgi:hypothetical protein